MTPPAEPMFDVGQQVPSLLGASLRMGAAVLLLAAIAGAWLVWKRRNKPVGRRLEIIDRVFLTRGASVALLRVEDRRILVGVSSDGVRLIHDLDHAIPADADADRFSATLSEVADV